MDVMTVDQFLSSLDRLNISIDFTLPFNYYDRDSKKRIDREYVKDHKEELEYRYSSISPDEVKIFIKFPTNQIPNEALFE